jgi:GNAT superfamily N-acetyltransferase
VIAVQGGELIGFVSITPPGQARYSLDGYLPRSEWPFRASDSLYEIRLLTVIPEYRGGWLSAALMYAALRYIEAQGGREVMATGRKEVASIYRRVGLKEHGIEIQSGQVTYLLMSAALSEIRARADGMKAVIQRFRRSLDWKMGVAFE